MTGAILAEPGFWTDIGMSKHRMESKPIMMGAQAGVGLARGLGSIHLPSALLTRPRFFIA